MQSIIAQSSEDLYIRYEKNIGICESIDPILAVNITIINYI